MTSTETDAQLRRGTYYALVAALTIAAAAFVPSGGAGARGGWLALRRGAPTPPPRERTVRLPPQTRALVALTYDDGLPGHVATAIPQLDAAGARGTFFLNTVGNPAVRDGFRAAAARGHELANHSLRHPCPAAYGWPDSTATEGYDADRFTAELREQHAYLRDLDDRAGPRSYAHPCSHTYVGDSTDVRPLLEASAEVTGSRTGGSETSIVRPGTDYDRQALPAYAVADGTGADALIAFARRAAEAGGAGVYLFHGVSDAYMSVSAEAHRALLDHFAAHPERYEVVTFAELLTRLAPATAE